MSGLGIPDMSDRPAARKRRRRRGKPGKPRVPAITIEPVEGTEFGPAMQAVPAIGTARLYSRSTK